MKKSSVEKNYFYSLMYQVISILSSVFMMPYLTRVIGAVGIGIYSYTTSVSYYFILFSALGINLYGQREISFLQNNKKQQKKTFLEIFIIKLFIMTLGMILYYIFVCNSKVEYSLYFKLLILEVFGNVIDISWYYSGIENFKRIFIKNIINKLLTVVAILLFVNDPNDLGIYVFIYGFSTFISNVSLYLKLDIKIKDFFKTKLNIKKHIKPILVLFLPQLAMSLYSFLDKVMIGYFVDDIREVGFYDQANKIIYFLLIFITSFGTVMLSRLTSISSSKDELLIKKNVYKSFNYIYFLSVPITLGIISISDNLIPWFLGDEFYKVSLFVKVLAILIIIKSLSNVIGEQYLIALRKEKEYNFAVITSSILNIILNLLLINFIGTLGAIIASVIAEFIKLLIEIILVRREFDFKIILKIGIKYIIAGLFMFLSVNIVKMFLSETILNTFLLIGIGIFTYIIVLIILKDEIMNNFKNKIQTIVLEK